MLSDIINEEHENVKYFPGIALPENLVAVADLEDAVADADILVFCVPHQFMRGIVKQIQGKARSLAHAQTSTQNPQPSQCRVCVTGAEHRSEQLQRSTRRPCQRETTAFTAGMVW